LATTGTEATRKWIWSRRAAQAAPPACDFVIDLGIEAGVTVGDVTNIVVRAVPRFAA
jgi:hypothetical protein